MKVQSTKAEMTAAGLPAPKRNKDKAERARKRGCGGSPAQHAKHQRNPRELGRRGPSALERRRGISGRRPKKGQGGRPGPGRRASEPGPCRQCQLPRPRSESSGPGFQEFARLPSSTRHRVSAEETGGRGERTECERAPDAWTAGRQPSRLRPAMSSDASESQPHAGANAASQQTRRPGESRFLESWRSLAPAAYPPFVRQHGV